ncbi:kinase-like protein [Rhizoclosmatium globosum]|uniref:non-specific serine/threonine protein kinase n=1 Tax=Rhizoclosmatium globosum TaxID=329046 RepID=A0A1Y2CQX0_9FUNG|nr:kinase-like protein [Rhizoclosmatium globosum]|eukprot:ORY49430.1 kinase-like protein [Rhizoclosmatium globosum]
MPKNATASEPIVERSIDSDPPSDAEAEEEEDEADYVKGGYHPVSIGDSYAASRYRVLRKLGWGHFSTVWLAHDSTSTDESPVVALKIVKSATHYTETALDEIKLLEKVVAAKPGHRGRKYIVELRDWFKVKGPNGSHVTMAFEVLGPNLLTLIRQYHHRGIPAPIVKRIMKQVLLGLDYLHSECKIIHTDLKPENVLICVNVAETVRKMGLAPPSNSSASTTLNTEGMTRSQKKKAKQRAKKSNTNAPEELFSSTNDLVAAEHKPDLNKLENPERNAALDAKSSEAGLSETERKRRRRDERKEQKKKEDEHIRVKIADLGNACWTHHHFTADIQTRQYRSPEAILGADYNTSADLWSIACMTFELLTGDYLFDPQAGSRYTKDDDHIAQISELLGGFPKSVALAGKYSSEIFNRRGELRHIHKLRFWGVSDVLQEKYHYSKEDAEAVAGFLLPMLEIVPEKRATAAEMLENAWIRDVDVESVGRKGGRRDVSVGQSTSDYASGGEDYSDDDGDDDDDDDDVDEDGDDNEDDDGKDK